MTVAAFRFYAELNFFLKPQHRQRLFSHPCSRDASVKHMIEALGVPHTEVALILVNGQPVDFSHRLQDQDHVSVYPWFSSLSPVSSNDALPGLLQPAGMPLFVADAHVGRLAKDLRMLGFDVLYQNNFSDDDVVDLAMRDHRIVLTRDRDLLIRKSVEQGCYLYATEPEAQLQQVIVRYQLADKIQPLSRCLNCNGLLQPVDKQQVMDRVPPRSLACSEHFFICSGCKQVYWEGSHTTRMRKRMDDILQGHQGAA